MRDWEDSQALQPFSLRGPSLQSPTARTGASDPPSVPSHWANGKVGSCETAWLALSLQPQECGTGVFTAVHTNGGDAASALFNKSSCRGWWQWLEVEL